MNEIILHFLDYFFLIFHTLFTIFNSFAWILKKTRKVHLLTMSLTAFSWFILGIWYGWGFCFCTEWHWQVRDALNNPIISYSYIHFLILEVTGVDFPPALVDDVVLYVFIFSFFMSIVLNCKDHFNVAE